MYKDSAYELMQNAIREKSLYKLLLSYNLLHEFIHKNESGVEWLEDYCTILHSQSIDSSEKTFVNFYKNLSSQELRWLNNVSQYLIINAIQYTDTPDAANIIYLTGNFMLFLMLDYQSSACNLKKMPGQEPIPTNEIDEFVDASRDIGRIQKLHEKVKAKSSVGAKILKKAEEDIYALSAYDSTAKRVVRNRALTRIDMCQNPTNGVINAIKNFFLTIFGLNKYRTVRQGLTKLFRNSVKIDMQKDSAVYYRAATLAKNK